MTWAIIRLGLGGLLALALLKQFTKPIPQQFPEAFGPRPDFAIVAGRVVGHVLQLALTAWLLIGGIRRVTSESAPPPRRRRDEWDDRDDGEYDGRDERDEHDDRRRRR